MRWGRYFSVSSSARHCRSAYRQRLGSCVCTLAYSPAAWCTIWLLCWTTTRESSNPIWAPTNVIRSFFQLPVFQRNISSNNQWSKFKFYFCMIFIQNRCRYRVGIGNPLMARLWYPQNVLAISIRQRPRRHKPTPTPPRDSLIYTSRMTKTIGFGSDLLAASMSYPSRMHITR